MNLGSDKETHVYACHLATSSSVKQHKLRKRIAWLASKEGIGKEFISLYVPPDATFEQVVATLKNQSESCDSDRENVQSRFKETFKNVIEHLKPGEKLTPEKFRTIAGLDWEVERAPVYMKVGGKYIEIPEHEPGMVRIFPGQHQ